MRSKISPALSGCTAFALVFICLGVSATNAQTVDAGSDYGPFDPVPDAQLRPLTTDRPGKSSSPVTVDPGHLQIEADLFNYSFSAADDTTLRQWSAPNVLLKYGLSDRVDLEAAVSGVNDFEQHDRATGQTITAHGIGDGWIGAKFNVFGDDAGDTPKNQAFAIIPMVKIPTAANGLGNKLVEATVALPYQFNLPDNWSLVVENTDGLRADHNGDRLGGDYQAMINLSHPLFLDSITAQVEYFYDRSGDPAIGQTMTFDPALQWVVLPNLAFDAGDYIGLDSKAPAQNPYVGISTRF